MANFVSFELSDSELQELRAAGWGSGRTDLMCQSIVRDYLRRMRFKRARQDRRKFGQSHHGHAGE
jgi:hypothetical protein